MCVLIVSSSGLCWLEDNGQPLRVMAPSFAGELGSGESEERRPRLPHGNILSPERRTSAVYIDMKEAECPSKNIGDLSDEDLFKELPTL